MKRGPSRWDRACDAADTGMAVTLCILATIILALFAYK